MTTQPQTPPDATIRRLSDERCNEAEIAAYTGHDPVHVAVWVAGDWWRPIGWSS